MNRKSLSALAAVLSALAPVFFGAARPLPAQSAYPQREFAVAFSGRAPDLDAHAAYNADEAQMLTALSEGLFSYDPLTLEPVPALAASHEVSGDGLLWTFHIREGAAFEDGTPITAATIRASWLSLLRRGDGAPYASMLDCIKGAREFRTGASRLLPEIRAAGRMTLEVELRAPTAHFDRILCHHAFSAVHPERGRAFELDAGEVFLPYSSGPFRVRSAAGREIVLEKNGSYWDAESVYLPSIKFLLMEDNEEATILFNQGSVQWLAGGLSLDLLIDYSALVLAPMFSTEYFFFKAAQGAARSGAARRALLLAAPWDELRSGYLIPATTLVFPVAGYPEVAGPLEQDMDRARELLREAGIDPAGEEPIVLFYPESSIYEAKTELLKGAWEELGFAVEKRPEAPNAYYRQLRGDGYTVGVTSWVGDFADPIAFLEMFRPASSLNDSGWQNARFEALVAAAARESDAERRYRLFAEAEQLLLDEAVILPLSHNPSLNVIDTNGLDGWHANVLDIHPFKYVRFVPRAPMPGIAFKP